MSYVAPVTFEPQSEDDPATNVSRVNGLYALRQSTVPAAIWKRSIPYSIQTWFDQIDPDTLPRARVKLMTQDVAIVARQACDEAGLPDCSERDWFVEDITGLAECFAGVMSTRRLQIRFDIITGNACKKFHTDVVKARLICTYRGPGTQYGMLTGGKETDQIFDVPNGCPIVLRGMRWPATDSECFRHRSPPIKGLGITRLNLVLDALDHDDDQGDHVNIHPEWVRDESF